MMEGEREAAFRGGDDGEQNNQGSGNILSRQAETKDEGKRHKTIKRLLEVDDDVQAVAGMGVRSGRIERAPSRDAR